MEPGMTEPFQPGKGVMYNPALGPVDATQKQEPRIEVLNALIRQIDLLTQSYTLEKAEHRTGCQAPGRRERRRHS